MCKSEAVRKLVNMVFHAAVILLYVCVSACVCLSGCVELHAGSSLSLFLTSVSFQR